ncbi:MULTISPECIES: hypothetical protein [unclassified Amycolatopsis]|uniref:hypothetical protein n=1 Tax=unclassified Amycolatopsis TaxID=2618356 RepID=UPI001C6A73CD|nr:hypothetical protein [Amycolatopsis sp. DSM 110486]QYN20253.1 hypothetical protein K1T34_48290 [Amycolatopsis sp. DSM 110486]
MAAVDRFYGWQVRAGHVRVNPVPQQRRRARPAHAGGGWSPAAEVSESPATYIHGAGREKVEQLPTVSYRQWWDVGMRGYTAGGLADPGFLGRRSGRNATFCDLMVRTGCGCPSRRR